VRLTQRLTLEEDIRATTEAVHGKLSDERWSGLWSDLLRLQKSGYKPRSLEELGLEELRTEERRKPSTPTSGST
jgi:hypothetical protein